MTKIVHPFGFRLGITKAWRTTWFSRNAKQIRSFVQEDFLIRKFLEKALDGKMVSKTTLERDRKDHLVITVHSARPGLIIGKDGSGTTEIVDTLKKYMRRNKFSTGVEVSMRVVEVKQAESEPTLVAEMIAEQLRKRLPHRKIMKQMIDKVMANRDVKGVRILLGGRLGGTDIARTEELKKGNIPLQTIRANVEFVHKPVTLSYGTIGVKVWIYKGDEFKTNKN
ncbi:MAG: 30S ribosomal protein S3 [Alphaproteobacteria bacterium]|nr:30S ribosomal protein S3 [Alphaproteobacteria bacterium]